LTTHLPVRPSWRCAACECPWPCLTACHELPVEFDGAFVSLALYLGRCFVDAAADLPDRPTEDLHRRFIGWLRPIRHSA
jgi:hypothetical protein